jgi:RNA polymerase sigma-70 factor (ECF subfamily)
LFSEKADDAEEVARAMTTLSAAHREVLMLAFWENMKYEEIGIVTGAAIGTVRSRLHHAKINLRRAIEADRERTA